jgi:TATA-box binding protein (TBP) (component of TFIID and TFIIIB)
MTDTDEVKLIEDDFKKLRVTTKTIIIITNINLNIKKIFNYLPITPYHIEIKKRGRKKKNANIEHNIELCSGSIITIKYGYQLRGVNLKNKIKQQKDKYFRNSITIVMYVNERLVNLKISQNGKIQLTGCKSEEHSEIALKYCWNYIKDNTELYTFNENESNLTATFIPAMTNVNFKLGFSIDKSKLSEYINIYTPYFAILKPASGYTGVNVKFPITEDVNDIYVKKIINIDNDIWEETFDKYLEYVNKLSDKERNKKNNKEKLNTFLIFHSGSVIMSGIVESLMENVYYEFINIMRECKDIIKEKLIE